MQYARGQWLSPKGHTQKNSTSQIPFIASIPLLIPFQESIGTAYGVWRSFNSAGITITDVSVGASESSMSLSPDADNNRTAAVQDRTPKGVDQYNGVFYFLIALKAMDVLYGLIYDVSRPLLLQVMRSCRH